MPKLHGFTLIELLITISIIGILSVVGLSVFGNGPQQKARDSRRKSDVQDIKKAMELFKGDTSGNSKYPNTTTGSLVSGNYMKSLPTDPLSSSTNYLYTPHQSDGSTACSGGGDTSSAASAGNCQTFTLTACLENKTDTGENVIAKPASGDGSACTGTKVYQITNP
jgi:prepilin-type N-terminal cleavage/methylation domain-containing protein